MLLTHEIDPLLTHHHNPERPEILGQIAFKFCWEFEFYSDEREPDIGAIEELDKSQIIRVDPCWAEGDLVGGLEGGRGLNFFPLVESCYKPGIYNIFGDNPDNLGTLVEWDFDVVRWKIPEVTIYGYSDPEECGPPPQREDYRYAYFLRREYLDAVYQTIKTMRHLLRTGGRKFSTSYGEIPESWLRTVIFDPASLPEYFTRSKTPHLDLKPRAQHD